MKRSLQEKIFDYDKTWLSNSEPLRTEAIVDCLTTLIGGKNGAEKARKLVKAARPLRILREMTIAEYRCAAGLTAAESQRVLSGISLTQGLMTENNEIAIHSPADAANLVMPIFSLKGQECFVVIVTDTRNKVLAVEEVYHGSLNSATIRISEALRPAIKINAAGILVLHNHPSGDPTPSPEDVALTRGIVQAGKLMDIEVLDHIVIGAGKYVSLKEKGLGFS